MSKFHVPVIQKFEWQPSVISRENDPGEATASKGNRYLITSGATGAWEGQDNKITYYDGTAWQFITPKEGMHTWVETDKKEYFYSDGSWAEKLVGDGDMKKSDYDTNDSGRVDVAEAVDDGTTGEANKSTAAEIRGAVDHADETGNPHETKADEIDTDESGETVQSELTALKTEKANKSDLDSHTEDTDNPHEVKADQIDTDESGETVQDKLTELDGKAHDQNTDTALAQGTADQVTAAEAKEAYDKRAVFVSEYDALEFDLTE